MRYSVELTGTAFVSRVSGNATDFDDLKAKINAIKASYNIKSVTIYIDDVEGGFFCEKKND